MGYSPILDGSDQVQVLAVRRPTLVQPMRTLLRFGGLAMDSATGTLTWKGRTIALPVREREVLSVLMRSAGQIVSRERLAKMLSTTASAIDERIRSLSVSLREAGVSTVPCQVAGIGYILWRS